MLGIGHSHCRRAAQDFAQQTRHGRRQVLYHQKAEAGVDRHQSQKALQYLKPAC
jgi:hypothetical protein